MGANRPRPGQRPNPGDRNSNGKEQHVINERIRAREVRLVGDNVEPGIYPIEKARRIAEDLELDLVEITAQADPPVCRIIDYQKFLYQQKKRQKEQKQKAAKVVVKEIRFGPQTDDHDYNFKLKHAIGFLKEGSKVKAYVFSADARSFSRSRVKCFSDASPTLWRSMDALSRCRCSKGSA